MLCELGVMADDSMVAVGVTGVDGVGGGVGGVSGLTTGSGSPPHDTNNMAIAR